VQPGAISREELRDGAVVVGRLDELDAYLAELEHRDPYLLVGNLLDLPAGEPEHVAVQAGGLFEAADGDADLHLYHFMHLVLADNAIARGKAHGRSVPLLRAGFHVGSCYEFYHAEGLNPTLYTDIVGQVTIELARIVENALPGQILVAEFLVPPGDARPAEGAPPVDAVSFVDRAQHDLLQLNGLVLSGDAIESIKCYLTGRARADGSFTIRKLAIHDKHGLTRNAFNAKVNIYRRAAEPILLGIEDRQLRAHYLQSRNSARENRVSDH